MFTSSAPNSDGQVLVGARGMSSRANYGLTQPPTEGSRRASGGASECVPSRMASALRQMKSRAFLRTVIWLHRRRRGNVFVL